MVQANQVNQLVDKVESAKDKVESLKTEIRVELIVEADLLKVESAKLTNSTLSRRSQQKPKLKLLNSKQFNFVIVHHDNKSV